MNVLTVRRPEYMVTAPASRMLQRCGCESDRPCGCDGRATAHVRLPDRLDEALAAAVAARAAAGDARAAVLQRSVGTQQPTHGGSAPLSPLKLGARGDRVSHVQQALNVVDHSALTVDGLFGPQTRAAVGDFQAQNDLAADGVVGSKTRAGLVARLEPVLAPGIRALRDALSDVQQTIQSPGPIPFETEYPPVVVRAPRGLDAPASGGCSYEPGEKQASASDPGSTDFTNGLAPTALDDFNTMRRAMLADELHVPLDKLDEELARLGLPAVPEYTPVFSGELVVSGFTQGSAEVKPLHQAFLAKQVKSLELDKPKPRYRVLRIEGYSDCVDTFSSNMPIRRARAEATRRALIAAGALEDNLGPAVAGSAHARVADQSTRAGRAANRAAVVALSLVESRRPQVEPKIPAPIDCDRPSDTWYYSTVSMVSSGFIGGTVAIDLLFINDETGCTHRGLYKGWGFTTPTVGASASMPSSPSQLDLDEPALPVELAGFGDVHYFEGGDVVGYMKGVLIMASGALRSQTLDLSGFQVQTPGKDAATMFGHLKIEHAGTLPGARPDDRDPYGKQT